MTKHIILLVLGILCFIYGVLIQQVNSGTRFFMVWYLISVVLVAFSCFGILRVWDRLPKGVVLACGSLCAIIAVSLVGTASIIMIGSTAAEMEDCNEIIVLGAQVKDTGPSVVLKYRLDAALDYLREYPKTVCIVSGAQGHNEPCTEAESMAQYLIDNGIESGRIIKEEKATNTVQNLEYSKPYCDYKYQSVGIVTNQFHMYRSSLIAKKLGYTKVVRIPAGSVPLYLPNNLLRECLALWKDVIVGNV